MNEQRIAAYLNLIQSLLTCADGEGVNLLAQNRELVDEGLVQTMVAVAQQYGDAGRENEAQWLIST